MREDDSSGRHETTQRSQTRGIIRTTSEKVLAFTDRLVDEIEEAQHETVKETRKAVLAGEPWPERSPSRLAAVNGIAEALLPLVEGLLRGMEEADICFCCYEHEHTEECAFGKILAVVH